MRPTNKHPTGWHLWRFAVCVGAFVLNKMAKQTHHWFPFYYEKFLIGTSDMSDKQVGAYIRLLIKQFDKGGIAENYPLLKKYPEVFEKFCKKEDGLYYNNTMIEIRDQQDNYRKNKSESGKLGALAKWQTDGTAITSPLANDGYKSKVKESKVKERIYIDGEDEILSSEIWHQQAGMALRVKPDQVLPLIKNFIQECKAKENWLGRPMREIKSHFVSWGKIELSKKKVEDKRMGRPGEATVYVKPPVRDFEAEADAIMKKAGLRT